MRVSVSVGDYAKIPYRIQGLQTDVFSMEELCYCIRENAFLLDVSLMNDELLGWIEKECGLHELAKKLHPFVHKKGTLSAFAALILRYVGFYDEETILDTVQVLKQGSGLSAIERRKSQVDHLVKNKRYRLGIREYDRLLEKWRTGGEEDGPDAGCIAAPDFLARIWHNKGAAYAGLMLYDRAAECFKRAWELEQKDEYCIAYLAAERLLLSDREYVAFVAEHKDMYQNTLKLEKQMEQYIQEWETQADYLRLYHRRELRQDGKKAQYYEESERLTRVLKDSYRNCQRSGD